MAEKYQGEERRTSLKIGIWDILKLSVPVFSISES